MCTVLLNATKVCSKALPCCGLARKADQRLVLCVPVLYNVGLISGGRQPCVRGKQASALFAQSRVLKEPKNLSALANNRVSAFQGL